MKQMLFSLIVFGFLFFAGFSEIYACQCMNISDKDRVKTMKKQADAIFVGIVKSLSKFKDEKSGENFNKIVLTVEKSWKSPGVEEYVIYNLDTGCSPLFTEGKSYLVYAVNDENNRLTSENCWGTAAVSFVRKDFKYLGEPIFVRKS